MRFLPTRPLGRIIGALVALVVAAGLWFAWQVHPLTGPGREVIVSVQPGESLSTLAGDLESTGVIGSAFALRLDTAVLGGLSLTAGSYQIRRNSSFAEVKSIFGNAPNVSVIDVSPGLTLREVANAVASDAGTTFANRFNAAATALASQSPYHPNGSLEGLIGPGSYTLAPGESAMTLAKKMVTRFDAQATRLGLTPTTRVDGLDAYQLLTAASIVEKEGYYPVNMPDVARVIYNRLARGGPLQMDATVLYYLHRDGGTVTPLMLQTQEPYNTYLNVGLTPTPICTVSKFSLDAVLHPPQGPWLYFTLINKDGREAFATTFAQQLANEALARKRGLA
ncbi:MAG: endolytic transglycosylase MltG [Acidimicrobiales bacterium]|jgi:UPF0755 protein